MTDLEDRLRTMLHERATDVTAVPALVDVPFEPRAQRARRTAWLVAAAVAVVLAVAAAAVVGTTSGPRSAPPADHGTPTVSSTPPPDHSVAKVPLAWFGMRAVPGFDRHVWTSDIGHRTLALRARADHDMPVGCNGCEVASDYVTVFEQHQFDAAKYHVQSWATVTVSGYPGRVGTMPWLGVPHQHRLPTLAWQFGEDQWAIVQGVTPLGGRRATLRSLARAVQPTVNVPITLPFTLDTGPNMPLTQITDDRLEGYSFQVRFENGDRSFGITLSPGTTYAGHYVTSTATPSTIDGLPGFIDATQGIAVRYHDGIAVLGFDGDPAADNGSQVGQRTAEQAAAIRAERLGRIAAGLHWTNGDGRAPYVPIEQAIP